MTYPSGSQDYESEVESATVRAFDQTREYAYMYDLDASSDEVISALSETRAALVDVILNRIDRRLDPRFIEYSSGLVAISAVARRQHNFEPATPEIILNYLMAAIELGNDFSEP
jgi:hypothetical protein